MSPIYTNADAALPKLLKQVLTQGAVVPSRNGDTHELLMRSFTLRYPTHRAPITTPGRNVSLPAQIAETMWLLAGRNDVAWLQHYLPRAAEFSDDGQVWRGGYGPRLRCWETDGGLGAPVDQLAHVVHLLQEDPSTRRAVMSIYNPAIDTIPGKDVPCNNWLHFIHRDGELHLHVATRSNDIMWGWSGINSFEWTILLTVVAGLTGLDAGSITFSISSLHLYDRHVAKAQRIVDQAPTGSSEPFYFNPEFVAPGTLAEFDQLVERWFRVEGQIRKGGLSDALLHQVASFPEPMLRSWLMVLLAWHHDDPQLARELEGTSLYRALQYSPKLNPGQAAKPQPNVPDGKEVRGAFTQFVTKLHREKHAAYGNSWKKRGEMLGIMANCARKVDRLGVAGGGDSAADTAIDLLVYLVKYELWLEEQVIREQVGSESISYTEGQEHVHRVEACLRQLTQLPQDTLTNDELVATVHANFATLEHLVEEKRNDRCGMVVQLQRDIYPLAVRLWAKEQAWHAGNATRAFSYEAGIPA